MDKIILTSHINNDKYTEYLYDHYDIQNHDDTISEIPIPNMKELNDIEWNIMLICGRSGSGKSTIMRMLSGCPEIKYDNSKSCISQFPNLSEEEVCELFHGVGLSSVPTWLRKPSELSNGEKARLDLCYLIANSKDGIVMIDEFTSVVNRDVAKSMSFSLQRYIRQHGLKCIISSCHFDVVEWLQPDVVYNLNKKDGEGNVELEHLVYSESEEYKQYKRVNLNELLTDRYYVE